MSEVQEEVQKQGLRVQAQQQSTSAAVAALSATRREAAAAKTQLAAARQQEAAFAAGAAHSLHHEAEEQHCELCGQVLHGEAAGVTRGHLEREVRVAEGRCEETEAAVGAAEKVAAAAAEAQRVLEAEQQVRTTLLTRYGGQSAIASRSFFRTAGHRGRTGTGRSMHVASVCLAASHWQYRCCYR